MLPLLGETIGRMDRIMENNSSDVDSNHSWNVSIEGLCSALEPGISRKTVRSAFAVLKQKWQADDETVDVKSMALYLNVSEQDAKKIIEHYESQHFCTKFKLK